MKRLGRADFGLQHAGVLAPGPSKPARFTTFDRSWVVKVEVTKFRGSCRYVTSRRDESVLRSTHARFSSSCPRSQPSEQF